MRNQNPTASFLINLDGLWGSGKSSFLRLLKSELEGKGKNPKWLVVDFNAWQESKNSESLVVINRFYISTNFRTTS